ncbi:MAG: HAMP domain-containing sensor histidine kinase [Planctomycetota bacterium]
MRQLGVFAALGALLLGAVGMLYALGLQGIRAEEERLQAEALGQRARAREAVVAEVAHELEALRTRESARPYDQFRHLYLPPELVTNSVALLVSPLAEEPGPGVAAYFELRDGVLSSPAFPGELLEAEAPTPEAASTLPALRRLQEHVELLPQDGPLVAPRVHEVDPLTCESNLSNEQTLALIDEASRSPQVDAELKGQWEAYRTRRGANDVDPASNYGQQAYVPQNKLSAPLEAPRVEVRVEAFRLFAAASGPDGWPTLLVAARRVQVPATAQTLEPDREWWQGLVLDVDWLRAQARAALAAAAAGLEAGPAPGALEFALSAAASVHGTPLPEPLSGLSVVDPAPPNATDFALARSRGVLHGALALALLVVGSGAWILGRILQAERTLARRRSDFVAALTHELKAPLTGMRAMVELLHDGLVTDPAKQQDYYGSLLQESERLSRLVRNVLDASRLERSLPLATLTRPLELAPTLIGIAESFRTRLEGAGFELEVELDDDLPAVQADPDALHQIVGNLLDNAAKYGVGAEKRIALSARAGAEGVEVRVRDWGPGVPGDEQRAIFERFVRGRSPQEVGGAGLGLAIARAQAEAMRAGLSLEPCDPGACFLLTFPAASA